MLQSLPIVSPAEGHPDIIAPAQQAGASRSLPEDKDPGGLSEIYGDETNIVIWNRKLSGKMNAAVNEIISSDQKLTCSLAVSADNPLTSLSQSLGPAIPAIFINDLAQLVDMFCCLFDLNRAGLRITELNHAMCPRFHVDRVPCRLVTTYYGTATEWLPNHLADRNKLGRGSQGKPDDKSGLFYSAQDICQLNCGDIALLKGESWENNEGAGLIHRSPALLPGERRLLLTLDFLND